MDTSDIIKHTMKASLGVVMSSTTDSIRHFVPSKIQCHSTATRTEYPTSTRFNNSLRFSLEQLKLNKRKLQVIKELKQGWNGYEGEALEESLISKIEEIISKLDYQPQIYPTGRGSIQLEKYFDENNLVEIEISSDNISAYQVKNGKETEKAISISEINDFISELYI